MKYTCLYIISLFFFLIGLSACWQEEYIGQSQSSDDLGDGLYLSLYLPDQLSKNATRAVNEDVINNMYAIYFQETGGSMKCKGYKKLKNETPDNDKVYHYKLTNYPTGSKIDIMFIANLENYITPPTDGSWEGRTADDMLENVLFPPSRSESVWAANDANVYIPMYTRARNLTIPVSLSAGTNYVKDNSSPVAEESTDTPDVYKLLRMVAKIEIENHLATANLESGNVKLTLSSVQVKNGHLKGFIGNNAINGTADRITTPTLYSIGNVGSGLSTVANSPSIVDNKQTMVFYLFETNVANADVKSESNCHIVLTGKKGTDTGTSTFMLPIPAVNASLVADKDNPGPVLRNHYYKYVIKGVADNIVAFEVEINVLDWVPSSTNVNLTVGE
ncbi:hypothetical protein [Bacteroides sp. 224]|uniref:hypothetical protein n=1 Tax=Bacteroides sp. 224 TaxID=2302936 RepID=UPI0013D09E77|nr:hypothetical protein [Bacteroides sp. 224]NDV65246.1 hypothetical protein [Bacteroides sp. 224]